MSFGAFLSTVSSTVIGAASKLTETIVEATQDFDKQQKAFVDQKAAHEREHTRLGAEAVAPWVGLHDEETLKTQIIALSADKRNFMIDPPSGTDFAFDITIYFPIAKKIMEVDERLSEMRFALVPKQIKEPVFWRNYFYRVSLIKQAAQLSGTGAVSDAGVVSAQHNEAGSAAAPASAQSPQQATGTPDHTDRAHSVSSIESAALIQPAASASKSLAPSHDDADFISDSIVHNAKPQAEGDQWMDQLKDELGVEYGQAAKASGSGAKSGDDYDWEKELEKELGEYADKPKAATSTDDA